MAWRRPARSCRAERPEGSTSPASTGSRRLAAEGGNLLGRLDRVSLAGGVVFLIVLGLGSAMLLRRLARYYRAPAPLKPGGRVGETAR